MDKSRGLHANAMGSQTTSSSGQVEDNLPSSHRSTQSPYYSTRSPLPPPRVGAHASWDDPRSFTLQAERQHRLVAFATRPSHHAASLSDASHSCSSPPLPQWRQMSRPHTDELLLDETKFGRWSDASSAAGFVHQSRSSFERPHTAGCDDDDVFESKRGHTFERRSPEKLRDLTTAPRATWTRETKQEQDSPHRHSVESMSSDVSVTGVMDVDSDAAHSELDVDEASPVNATTTAPAHNKKSRYLREMDRRVILERLAKGERQATLAKEFSVSRAAICNLFKHRAVVLARSDENPFAKHPKKKIKPRAKHQKTLLAAHGRSTSSTSVPTSDTSTVLGATTTTTTTMGTDTSASMASCSSMPLVAKSRAVCKTLHEVRSQSVQLLVSMLSDRSRSLEDFHRACNRVLWLVLEEALSLVPLKEHNDEELAFSGVTVELPPCAISMERQSLEINPMLDIFHMMEPHQPSGTARVTLSESAAIAAIADADLPPSLHDHNVFLLDFVSASGEAVCVVIEQLLLDHRAVEVNLTVVALFVSSEVVAMVQCKYPSVRIVTARVDSSITRRRVALTAVDLILHRIRQSPPQ